MIIAGNNQIFAIAAEITGTPNGWILGRFRFVLHGRSCGNWHDEADLRGCYGWLKDFAKTPRPRVEPELLNLPPDAVFDRLVRPVLNQASQAKVPTAYQDTFARFHISHLGMSSFDRVVMVLIENSKVQRCVWEDGQGDDIHDDTFPSGHMQQIAGNYCTLMESEAAALGISL